MVQSRVKRGRRSRISVRDKRKNHAIVRAMDRYGVLITIDLYELLVNKIQGDQSKFLLNISKSKTVHNIQHCGEEYWCVYSRTSKCIVTFLHKSWVSQDKDGNWEFSQKFWSYHRKRKHKQNIKKYRRKLKGLE